MTLENFSRYCGPAAVASAMGITRMEAAERIRATRTRKHRRGFSGIDELGRVLGLPVEFVTKADASGGVRSTGPGGAYRRYGRACDVFPTLAQWLKANPTREAVLRSSHHFVHVRDGRCIETNGWEPRRGRVTHAIFLDA